MPGEIVLVGGDEFRPDCEEMDSTILRASGASPPKVLILPTAAVTGPQKAASDGVRHFSKLGAQASELMVLDKRQANDEELIQAVSGASLVYFTGGDPNYLLATLRGTKLFDRLKEALGTGTIVGGSSAGAMVMGSFMWRHPSRDWVQGLGVAEGIAVLPHHETGDPNTVLEWLANKSIPPEMQVLGIDAKTCCLGAAGDWKVLGAGKVTLYQNGSWTIFNSGESLPAGP